MKTNIFDVRFVDNNTDKVFHVTQYGKTLSEVSKYWQEYFKHGRDADKYTYIDSVVVKGDVKVSENKMKKHLNMFDFNKMHLV